MCTGIKITSKEENIFFGRTMDLYLPMFGEDPGMNGDIKIISIPKGIEVSSQLQNWKSKYSVLGMGTNSTSVLYDGINDCGLAGDAQVLMEATRGDEKEILKYNKTGILSEEFLVYILTNFKSVQEIKDNYSKYGIINQAYVSNGIDVEIPLHYTFVDESGDGVVLEPVLNGSFKLYDFLGVTTNSPEYDYHQINLRNYLELNNVCSRETVFKNNVSLLPIDEGTGYGLLGMPGDYTSPSRFIRSFYYLNMIDEFESEQGINRLYAMFRSLMIPRGINKNTNTDVLSDYTRYWVGYDLSSRRLVTQSGQGLCFTSKILDPHSKNINYYDVNLEDNLYEI